MLFQQPRHCCCFGGMFHPSTTSTTTTTSWPVSYRHTHFPASAPAPFLFSPYTARYAPQSLVRRFATRSHLKSLYNVVRFFVSNLKKESLSIDANDSQPKKK